MAMLWRYVQVMYNSGGVYASLTLKCAYVYNVLAGQAGSECGDHESLLGEATESG